LICPSASWAIQWSVAIGDSEPVESPADEEEEAESISILGTSEDQLEAQPPRSERFAAVRKSCLNGRFGPASSCSERTGRNGCGGPLRC
jgi:hypothetical protein